ncbi:MAG: hypothetical protein Q8916_09405 [Bacteroidota bacterium]|nr:hypothetical protein [Bacteroidota bacterium]MDP4230604.1 hypothetical protein [Bacteroidota bacterium]MDP4235695.1 hypothetical protein [Bacteroidota bacterium]
MDTTISRSNQSAPSPTYEDSANRINLWHKRIGLILVLGVVISLLVLANFFFISPPHSTSNTAAHLRSSLESFLIGCLAIVGALYFGLTGRNIVASEEVSENDELIHEQKRLAGFSLGLFLVSDTIIILLSSPFWH